MDYGVWPGRLRLGSHQIRTNQKAPIQEGYTCIVFHNCIFFHNWLTPVQPLSFPGPYTSPTIIFSAQSPRDTPLYFRSSRRCHPPLSLPSVPLSRCGRAQGNLFERIRPPFSEDADILVVFNASMFALAYLNPLHRRLCLSIQSLMARKRFHV